jgi:hypothetical protein
MDRNIQLSKTLEVPHDSRDSVGMLKPLPRATMGSISVQKSKHTELVSTHTCQTFCNQCTDDRDTCIKKCEQEKDTTNWSCKLFQ